MNEGNYKTAKEKVLAINAHLKHLNVELTLEEQDHVFSPYANDFTMNVSFKNHNYRFRVNVKKSLAGNSALTMLNEQLSLRNYDYTILLSDYIAPEVSKYLLEKNISFINGSGKVFIQQDQLMLYFDYPAQRKKSGLLGSAFEPSGIKLIFYLLNKPESVANSYKELAQAAGISTGSITKIIADLKRNGFVYTKNNKRLLRNKKELLDQWAVAYGRKVRPKSVVRKYRLLNSPLNIQLPEDCLWGGEVAAEIIQLNLKGQKQIIYTKADPVEVVKKLRLIPDEKGQLELLTIFWNPDKCYKSHFQTVPDVLIYADLMLSKNDRNIEIAHELFK